MAGSPQILPVSDIVMPWIALVAAEVPKMSPCSVAALVSCSSARWRGKKYGVYLSHVCSAAGLPSHSMQSFGKEFTVRSECVAKAARGSPEKGWPDSSAFSYASSVSLIHSRTRGLLIQKDERRRKG